MQTGANQELLRENGAYICVKDAEERDNSLLNLGGTTRAFVPFGGGGVFVLCAVSSAGRALLRYGGDASCERR